MYFILGLPQFSSTLSRRRAEAMSKVSLGALLLGSRPEYNVRMCARVGNVSGITTDVGATTLQDVNRQPSNRPSKWAVDFIDKQATWVRTEIVLITVYKVDLLKIKLTTSQLKLRTKRYKQ